MPTFQNMQISPPKLWEEFEDICYDLWKKIWNDPNTQKNGRQGQPQRGVDVYGRPVQGKIWAGVQCKGKDTNLHKKLKKVDIYSEVEKAKKFEPELSHFIIATTSSRDEKLQTVARQITETHLNIGLFSVKIAFWEDIIIDLADYPELVEKHYPGISADFRNFKDKLNKVEQKIDEKHTALLKQFSSHCDEITTLVSSAKLTPEYNAELNYAEILIKRFSPSSAIDSINDLKSRIWGSCDNDVKVKILTLLGSAELMKDNINDAAQYFIKAYNLDPSNEKSICNYGLSLIMTDQCDESLKILDEILNTNPVNTKAITLKIHALSKIYDYDQIIGDIPESAKYSPEVAFALSKLAWDSHKKEEAIKWLKSAIKNDSGNNPTYKATLGCMLLELERKNLIFRDCNQLSEIRQQSIVEAINYVEEAIKQIQGTEYYESHIGWVLEVIEGYRVIKMYEKAENHINLALAASPQNIDLLFQKSAVSFELGKVESALELFDSSPVLRSRPEYAFFHAEILSAKLDYVRALQCIDSTDMNELPSHMKLELGRLKIRLLSENNRFEDAELLLGELQSEFNERVLLKIDAALIQRKKGDIDQASLILNEISGNQNGVLDQREQNELADELYALGEYSLAAKHYGEVIKEYLLNDITKRLAESFYKSGQIGEALKICHALREKYGVIRGIAELEFRIYQEIDDYESSYLIGKQILEDTPDDIIFRINFAGVLLQAEKFDELDEFLNRQFDISKINSNAVFMLVHLLIERKRIRSAFDLLYEFRRNNFSNPDVHLKYIGLFILRNDEYPWLDHDIVQDGSAVYVEENSGNTKHYIIENRMDSDFQKNELNINESLSKALLGKSVGEVVLLEHKFKPIRIGRINKIKSKYVHAFHESLNDYPKFFVEHAGFLRLDFEPDLVESNPKLAFADLLKILSIQSRSIENAESGYKNGTFTIGAFAKLIGTNYYDVLVSLQSNKEMGIFCSFGSSEELDIAGKSIDNNNYFIIDPITYILIHQLNIAEIVNNTLGSLYMSQSAFNEIQNIRDEKVRCMKSGQYYMGINKGIPFSMHESGELIKKQVEFLNRILEFAKEQCQVVACEAALKVNRNKREELDRILGRGCADSILLASEKCFTLYSDDRLLRGLGKMELSVQSVWTQIVLMKSKVRGQISEEDYNKIVIKLIEKHHKHISINSDIVLTALQTAEWISKKPFVSVVDLLNGKHCDYQSAITVATNFLYSLWTSPIICNEKDNITLYILRSLAKNREFNKIINLLLKQIKNKFHLLPIHLADLLNLIDIWRRNHLA